MNCELATAALKAGVEEAKRLNCRMNIAVVDAGGHLVAFIRMDHAVLGAIDVAVKKAKTAIYFNSPSGALGKISNPGGPIYGVEHSNQGLITFPGGLPIHCDNGKPIGAIGVSGDNVINDEKVAEAAINALK